MGEDRPVVEVRGQFADELHASQAADALDRWFAWILAGSPAPVPDLFEPLGVATASWAWSLEEDVDWEIGPHARAVGAEVRVSVVTRDTYRRLAGLLRLLGAASVQVHRGE
jgi:hypothetical protein